MSLPPFVYDDEEDPEGEGLGPLATVIVILCILAVPILLGALGAFIIIGLKG